MMIAKFTMIKSQCIERRIIYNVDYISFILDGKWLKIKYKEYNIDKILMLKTENIEEFVEEFNIEEEECE